MELMLDIIRPCLQAIRAYVIAWSLNRPALALSMVILSCVILLPFISATALMPVVFLFDLSNFIATKGIISVMYTVLFEGLFLGFILVILFFAAFAIATSASVLHSYQHFHRIKS